MRVGPFYGIAFRGGAWFRINDGWGLSVKSHKHYPPLFSERTGITKRHHIGRWCFGVLRPDDVGGRR